MVEELKADYCIVGAGIAGLLVASRLARTGKRVLVVEQGPRATAETRADILRRATERFEYGADYNDGLGEDILTPTSGVTAGRLFGTGGTALHFGGWMVRPVKSDLKTKSLFGIGRDWPLSYEDLEPWLTDAEYEIGVPGKEDNRYAESRSKPFPMPAHAFSWFDESIFRPAIEKLGMEAHSCPFAVTSQPYQRKGFAPQVACAGCRFCKACPTGARYSPDRIHGAWLATRPNVTIRNHLSLRRLETSPNGGRIVAAHAKTIPGHDDVVVTAKQFALTMGGVATTRVLLLSKGTGAHKDGIGNANGQIGRQFGDHFGSIAVLELDRHVGGRLGFTTIQCDHGRSNEVDRREEPSWILVGEPLGDIFPMHSAVVPWAIEGDRLSLSRLREILPRVVTFYAMHEYSDTGTFDLDPDHLDAFKDPIARMTVPATEWDERAGPTFKRLIHRLGDAMNATANRFISDPFCAYGHPAGATAMATTPEDGVCDTNAKVFGVDNLYLCSASVLPHMGANPPTLTIAALALRLASHLKGKR